MEKTISILQIVFLSFVVGALVWSAKAIQKGYSHEESQNRAILNCMERLENLEQPKTHQTFDVLAMPALENEVSPTPPKSTLGTEGDVEDLDKLLEDFPEVEEPEEEEEEDDGQSPSVIVRDESDPYQVESEAQIQTELGGWAGPNVCDLPTIR